MNMEEFNSKFKKSLNDRSMVKSFMRNTTFKQISNKKGGSNYDMTTNKDPVENNDYFAEFECY